MPCHARVQDTKSTSYTSQQARHCRRERGIQNEESKSDRKETKEARKKYVLLLNTVFMNPVSWMPHPFVMVSNLGSTLKSSNELLLGCFILLSMYSGVQGTAVATEHNSLSWSWYFVFAWFPSMTSNSASSMTSFCLKSHTVLIRGVCMSWLTISRRLLITWLAITVTGNGVR